MIMDRILGVHCKSFVFIVNFCICMIFIYLYRNLLVQYTYNYASGLKAPER